MIDCRVNGKPVQFSVEPEQPLLWVLRDTLKLKGTKYGCGVGICGICSVHVDGELVRSCMTPVGTVENREVTTIEGFSLSHPVVSAWLSEGVAQCGYCQPGQVMAAVALLRRNPNPSDADINDALSGVLCRCGTYPRIRRAIHRAAERVRSGDALSTPSTPTPEIDEQVVTEPNLASIEHFAPNPWVRVHADGHVTLMIDRSEMGQGVITGFAMLVAEELEIDLHQIRTVFAPAERVYFNPLIGEQLTGGSTSIRGSWEPLRRAGAEAREILIQAAASIWDVPGQECRAQHGQVLHPPSNRRLGYGELVNAARSVPVPVDIPLKNTNEFKLIGRPVLRLDAPAMVLGRAVYGMDVELPGKLVASIAHAPMLGGRPRNYDASETYQIPGVKRVVKLATGVAVIADSTYAALNGRAALKISWKLGRGAMLSTASIVQGFRQAARRKGAVQRRQGQALRVLKKASRLVEAEYQTPYLAHACMEPMNCTARIGRGRCDIWVGTQAQTGDQRRTARMAWMRKKQVNVHTQFLGGGFGRRGDGDFVREAVRLAREVDGPVQLVWTRQDDIQHDRYRPANYTILKASLDTEGMPEAWFQRVVGPPLALIGININYAISHIRIECVEQDPGVPTGAWRSVGASQNAFAVECFIDELANSAGIDPIDYRLALLKANSRHLKVLEIAADKAGWRRPAVHGRHSGVAFFHGFKSTVAQIAEVSVSTAGEIKVHRVVCIIDCGIVVNPDQVMAQLEGAIIFGLSAALKGQISIEQGQIQQANFEDYPILTLAETPEIEVHIVPSQDPPGGVGEPGVPPIAPAVANAVFAATGKRLRSLPLQIG